MITLNVTYSGLYVDAECDAVSGQIGVLRAQFSFSEDWNEFPEKTAVFCGSGSSVSVLLGESLSCEVPSEVTEKPGKLVIGVFATVQDADGRIRRYPGKPATVEIGSGTPIVDTLPGDDEISSYEQLLYRLMAVEEALDDSINRANTAAAGAESAAVSADAAAVRATDASVKAETNAESAKTAAEVATRTASAANKAAKKAEDAAVAVSGAVERATEAAIKAEEAASGVETAISDATAAAAEAQKQAEAAENAAQNVEEAISAANTAAQNADRAASDADNAASSANSAASSANAAASAADTAASDATTAASDANKAASSARTAANNAAAAAQNANEQANFAYKEGLKTNTARDEANTAAAAALDAANDANEATVSVHEWWREERPLVEQARADSETATASANTAAQNANNATERAEALLAQGIPKNTSDLNNDSGFITNAVTDLVNYYLKSETYTREEVLELISSIPKFSIAVVSALPTSDISETTVYLVKSGDDQSNLYTEYIRANGAWEMLGRQEIDLTGYATETWVNTKLKTKLDDFTIEIYNGNNGNPKPVRFASFNYSTCNSEEGIAAKISLVSGHGNGSSYAFLQDAIIKVTHTGSVSVDNFKYYGASAGTYDGAARQYGDIFWLVDETNKIVDFYCLMGQYARVKQTPWKRLTYSTKGTVTQYTTCTVYSSGTMNWGNNAEIALSTDLAGLQAQFGTDIAGIQAQFVNYLPLAGGAMTGSLVFNGGDAAGASKIVLATGEGQITNSGTQTLFGFIDATTLAVGHSSYAVNIRGNATRPLYNSKEMALFSDVSALDTRLSALESSAVSLLSGTSTPTADQGEDGDIYLVTG